MTDLRSESPAPVPLGATSHEIFIAQWLCQRADAPGWDFLARTAHQLIVAEQTTDARRAAAALRAAMLAFGIWLTLGHRGMSPHWPAARVAIRSLPGELQPLALILAQTASRYAAGVGPLHEPVPSLPELHGSAREALAAVCELLAALDAPEQAA
jgi:hypothetical protein